MVRKPIRVVDGEARRYMLDGGGMLFRHKWGGYVYYPDRLPNGVPAKDWPRNKWTDTPADAHQLATTMNMAPEFGHRMFSHHDPCKGKMTVGVPSLTSNTFAEMPPLELHSSGHGDVFVLQRTKFDAAHSAT